MKKITIIYANKKSDAESFLGVLKCSRYDLGSICNGKPFADFEAFVCNALQVNNTLTIVTDFSHKWLNNTLVNAKNSNYYIRLFCILSVMPSDCFLESFQEIISLCDEVVFSNGESNFCEMGEYRFGQFYPRGANQPQWIESLLKNNC